ncbi:flagellar biosynthesis protein FlaG [Pseudoalteromonas phenolica]|uniref:flagellar protein FlaG n=1 Tax=Pseudoalteromonas phenolica TaxID=161398 RepID=UPI00110B0FF3|nr:flagellar protein FlaG [Pseudoalteromonas phenolica]TMN93836.1 flagellar biosynthesis protein FlaG [Pseudoalteromonas phenolica]
MNDLALLQQNGNFSSASRKELINSSEGLQLKDSPSPVEHANKIEAQEQKQTSVNQQLAEAQQLQSVDVKASLDKLNEIIPVTSTNLSFEFDESGDPPFIRVIDKDSDEVIREIPSEDIREIAKALDDFADTIKGKGLIFDHTA